MKSPPSVQEESSLVDQTSPSSGSSVENQLALSSDVQVQAPLSVWEVFKADVILIVCWMLLCILLSGLSGEPLSFRSFVSLTWGAPGFLFTLSLDTLFSTILYRNEAAVTLMQRALLRCGIVASVVANAVCYLYVVGLMIMLVHGLADLGWIPFGAGAFVISILNVIYLFSFAERIAMLDGETVYTATIFTLY